MSPTKYHLSVILLLAVTSCGLFDSHHETIKGKYNVGWIDTQENRSISYALDEDDFGGVEKIGPSVRRWGANDRFIIAERTMFNRAHNDKTPTITTYYIIDMEIESPYDNKDVIGPLSSADFEKMKSKLEIQNLAFIHTYY